MTQAKQAGAKQVKSRGQSRLCGDAPARPDRDWSTALGTLPPETEDHSGRRYRLTSGNYGVRRAFCPGVSPESTPAASAGQVGSGRAGALP